jgi:hypothetical protein
LSHRVPSDEAFDGRTQETFWRVSECRDTDADVGALGTCGGRFGTVKERVCEGFAPSNIVPDPGKVAVEVRVTEPL